MGWVNDMGRLTQEIPRAFDARMNDLKSRRAGGQRFLSDVRGSRKHSFRALHQQILACQRERNQQVAAMRHQTAMMMSGLHREQAAAHSHWQSMANGLARKRAGVR